VAVKAWHVAAAYSGVSCLVAAVLQLPVLFSSVFVGNALAARDWDTSLVVQLWGWLVTGYLFSAWVLPFYSIWAVVCVAAIGRSGLLWLLPIHLLNLVLVFHGVMLIVATAAR
jgi:hypothetical protein